MNSLLHAYLIHIEHYLANREILFYFSKIEDGDLIYRVTLRNECLAVGSDVVEIENDDLLAFLYECTLK